MQPTRVSEPLRLQAPFYTVKRLISRAICHPLVGRLISSVFRDHIPSGGTIIHTGDHSVVPKVKAELFWGIYESAEVRFVRDYLRTDLDVVELGSSLGVVTSQILRRLDSNRRLVCVEANPNLLETLRSNIEENGKGRNVTIIHGAVAEVSLQHETVSLLLGEDNTVSHVSGGASSPRAITVPGFELSTILKSAGIDGDFALVSDIEGAEASFIVGDTSAFERCRQMIIELHETEWRGKSFTVDELRSAVEHRHGFHLIASRGPVCVFEKS